MAKNRTDYETKSATTTKLHFSAEPPMHWVWRAIHLGATRVDVMGRSLYANFPTWQQSADFHDHVNTASKIGDAFHYAAPIPLAPTRTYETLITDTMDYQRRHGKPTHLTTYTPQVV